MGRLRPDVKWTDVNLKMDGQTCRVDGREWAECIMEGGEGWREG